MNHQAQSPTVSVMIPYYNCKEYIVETVQSVLSQSYQNFESSLLMTAPTRNMPII